MDKHVNRNDVLFGYLLFFKPEMYSRISERVVGVRVFCVSLCKKKLESTLQHRSNPRVIQIRMRCKLTSKNFDYVFRFFRVSICDSIWDINGQIVCAYPMERGKQPSKLCWIPSTVIRENCSNVHF